MEVAFILSPHFLTREVFMDAVHKGAYGKQCHFFLSYQEVRDCSNHNFQIVFCDDGFTLDESRGLYNTWVRMEQKPKVILLLFKKNRMDLNKLHKHALSGVDVSQLSAADLSSFITYLLDKFSKKDTILKKNVPYATDCSLLTRREKEILKLFINGSSYKEVSVALSVSLDTVRAHIRNIYRKLKVNSKAQAIIRVIESEVDLN